MTVNEESHACPFMHRLMRSEKIEQNLCIEGGITAVDIPSSWVVMYSTANLF